jgi:hypothetical protein
MNGTSLSKQVNTQIKAASLQPVIPKARSKGQCLLVLDGANLMPKVLSAAETRCLQVSGRVDILLANSSKAPEAVLHRLLISLERSGIDYRLTSASGEMGNLITQYLRRHAGVRQIMVATLPSLGEHWDLKVADLRYQGYSFVSLIGLNDA